MRPLALSLLVLLTACKGGGGSSAPPADWQPSMKASDWSQPYGQSASVVVPQATSGGWLVDIPAGPCVQGGTCPNAGYLLTGVPGAIQGKALVATIAVELSPGATLRYDTEAANTCIGQPTARLLVQRKGDDLTKPNHRWWSNPEFVALAPGTYSIRVPLTSDHWSNVNGVRSATDYAAALNDAWRVGMTLGGGCFFGHGIYVMGGTARLIVTAFKVER